MAKHRAETGRSASTPGPKHAKPRHRRRKSGYVAVVPFAALTLVAGGGATATALTQERPTVIGLGGADKSSAALAAVVASRQELLPSSRGLGVDRLTAMETQARKARHLLAAREAEREAERIARQKAAEERRQEAIEARQWGAPIEGYSISASYGDTSSLWSSGMHTGVDLNAVTGTPVTSVGPGTVTFTGYDGSYGNKIIVQHDDGTETWYCHLSAINVSVGQSVTNETVIGLVGATGNVTGDHLHLELRPVGGGDPVDPVAGLAAHGVHL